MNTPITTLKRAALAATVSLGLGLGSGAHAIPISGTFTLTGDPLGNLGGLTVARGDFTTGGADAVVADGFSDADGATFDTIGLTRFDIVDLTGVDTPGNTNAPLGLFADFSLSSFVGTGVPVGILSNDDPDTILAFVGFGFSVSADTGNPVFLSLGGPNAPLAAGQGSQFSLVNLANGADVSGVQVVPEPSALALLGAGVLAFGALRRRRSISA